MSTSPIRTSEGGNFPHQTNGTTGQEAIRQTRSACPGALEQIERIKTKLRSLLNDLNETVSMLKTAGKEQRATTREIEAVRSKLREIRGVEI